MEAVMDVHVAKTIINDFEDLSGNLEIFVEPEPESTERFKLLTKKLYDFTVAANTLTSLTAKSLRKLLIKGFDEEQIWQQIDIQNGSAVPYFTTALSSIDPEKVTVGVYKPAVNYKKSESAAKYSDYDSSAGEEEEFEDGALDSIPKLGTATRKNPQEEYVFDDDSDSSADIFDAADTSFRDKINLDSDEEDDGDDSSVEVGESNDKKDETPLSSGNSNSSAQVLKSAHPKTASKNKSLFKSEVDDQFFKLSKLEEFLRIEDLKEEKQVTEDSDDEDDIDLFQDIPSENDLLDEESDQEGEMVKKSSRDLMYEDFFDAPESEGENDNASEQSEEMEVGEQSEDDSEDMQEHEDTVNNSEIKEVSMNSSDAKSSQKTAFELEQEDIKIRIGKYEKSMLEPLPWHLTGEVAASSRPVDSLIHHEAEFESNLKQDHVTDNSLNEGVENILKKLIANKAFQDVERKYKPTEEIIAYKKEVKLDQTKSQKSLAEVYEEDYLKKQNKQQQEEVEDPKHVEIKKLMDSLFPELQALFSHIPKPAVPELKVVNNLPAVTVEEVAPTSVSDATLLAPEEVKSKSGLVKGKTERTDTDRKRERRKKKELQKVKAKKMKKKLEEQKANPSARQSKLEKLEILKKLKQHRNTKIAKVSGDGKIKSSKDFFSRLQDTMDSKVKTNTTNSVKKKVK